MVELYERPDGIQPVESFFASIPGGAFDRLAGYIDSIAADPVSFPPGPAWQAMHGPALGCHEARVRIGKHLYRIFVRLDAGPFPEAPGLGRLVLLTGERKRTGTQLPASVYRRVGEMAADYLQARKVSLPVLAEQVRTGR